MHTFTTYNVLANSMATQQFFKARNDVLSLKHRMPLILREIKNMMKRMDVIALQEVDIKVASSGLHQAFMANGYYPLTAHYSTMEGRDFFGNIIAFPIEKYNLENYGQVKVGQFIVPSGDQSTWSIPKTGTNTLYQEAKCRDSCLLFAILSYKETPSEKFAVFTYHMPCAFWWPPVMTLHADAIMSLIERHREGLPYILLGDFNTKPNTPIHTFLKTGTITDPTYLPYVGWKSEHEHERERELNMIDNGELYDRASTQCRNGKGELFRDNIDYIFSSTEWKLLEFKQENPTEDMPNDTHG